MLIDISDTRMFSSNKYRLQVNTSTPNTLSHPPCTVPKGPYIYFKVPALATMRKMSIQSTCMQQWLKLICALWVFSPKTQFAVGSGLHICWHWFCVTLLANFSLFLCLYVKFHISSFWVPILAVEGPCWVPISWKFGSLLGPYLYFKVPIFNVLAKIHAKYVNLVCM